MMQLYVSSYINTHNLFEGMLESSPKLGYYRIGVTAVDITDNNEY